jgi:hypothetical protein
VIKSTGWNRSIEFVSAISKENQAYYSTGIQYTLQADHHYWTESIVLTFVDILQEIQYQRHFELHWIDRYLLRLTLNQHYVLLRLHTERSKLLRYDLLNWIDMIRRKSAVLRPQE